MAFWHFTIKLQNFKFPIKFNLAYRHSFGTIITFNTLDIKWKCIMFTDIQNRQWYLTQAAEELKIQISDEGQPLKYVN